MGEHVPADLDDIIGRQREFERERRQDHEAWLARQRAEAEFAAAGNAVEDLGGGYHLAVLNGEPVRPDDIREWVAAMAAWRRMLQQRDLHARLDGPPAGAVPEDQRDVHRAAVRIFESSESSPDHAAEVLASIATLPFAADVGWWLRTGLRRLALAAAEHWQAGPARSQPPPLDDMPVICCLGDRTYRVGGADPVPVSDTYDNILQAFIGHPTLDLAALARRSGLEAGHVKMALKRLRAGYGGVFKDAIFCPGPGGKGLGYRATVIDARPGGQG